MPWVRVKVDISGTVGAAEAWQGLRHYEHATQRTFAEQGGSGPCRHPAGEPHPNGEWRLGRVEVPTSLLAQYAIRYYLEQERVLDAETE